MLALITGASSGIGKALVTLLRSEGVSVVGAARSIEAVEGEAIHYDLPTLLSFIETRCPDLVIHAAGFGFYGDAINQDPEQVNEIFQLHVMTTLKLARALTKSCQREKKEGVLFVISSVAGEISTPGMAVYGASKAATTHLCESLDFELSPYGVRVLVSCPGMVKTPFSSRAAGHPHTASSFSMTAEKAAKLMWRQIIKRKGKTIIDWRYKMLLLFLPFISKKRLQRNVYQSVISR